MNSKFYRVSVTYTEAGSIFDVEPVDATGYFEAGLVRELTCNVLSVKLPWTVPGYREFLVWAPSVWDAADRVFLTLSSRNNP